MSRREIDELSWRRRRRLGTLIRRYCGRSARVAGARRSRASSSTVAAATNNRRDGVMKDRKRTWTRRTAAVATVAAAATCLLGSTSAEAGLLSPSIMIEKRVDFVVTLSDDQDYTVAGHLSMKLGGNCGLLEPRTLQVLLHGGTYDHEYWDGPLINGERYSYADYMTERCYAVLALDMLGAGASSAPPGDLADLAESASALDQVLTQVRSAGPCWDPVFDKIALVGHSMGTITSVYTLGSYGPVADALVATGWAHAPRIIPIDPAAFAEPLQQPYVVIPPPVRELLFYYPPTSDPDVIAYDNANMVSGLPRGLMLERPRHDDGPRHRRPGGYQRPVARRPGRGPRAVAARPVRHPRLRQRRRRGGRLLQQLAQRHRRGPARHRPRPQPPPQPRGRLGPDRRLALGDARRLALLRCRSFSGHAVAGSELRRTHRALRSCSRRRPAAGS
ncbi:alpha/beta hydrolase [Nannocystis pusilla]|uniref:alpha/beta hydrolase n=1 Tax=Nannocystis pusilla TaxID=889268 RepID=UPI003DA4BC12